MSNKTRKYLWPVSLVMSIGIIGALAAFLVLAGSPGSTSAHAPGDHPDTTWPACADMTDAQRGIHNGIHANLGAHGTMDPCPTGTNGGTGTGTGGTGTTTPAAGDMVKSSSSSGSASPEIKLIIASLDEDRAVGSSIVLYLEDDFVEPSSIPATSVYIVAEGTPSNVVPETGQSMAEAEAVASRQTGNGSRVYVTSPAKVKTDAYFDLDKKDIAIRVLVPDMCTNATNECEGPNGLRMGQTVTVVFESDSGIKNPSEQKDSNGMNVGYKTGYTILTPIGDIRGRGEFTALKNLLVKAKINLSDVDDKRGYELTIIGSGFNNGTTASAYVLKAASAPADCETLVSDSASTLIGSGLVASDDKVTITAEVTVPSFGAGNVNQICMVDGENRYSSDIDDFKLESSIRIVPNMVSSGDTVNVFAQDYPLDASGGFEELKLAGQVVYTTGALNNAILVRSTSLTDGSATATFDVPGSVGNKPLQGTVRVDATWGTTTENTLITVAGSELTSSASDILPNESITISGNGYGSQSCIDVADIKLDNVAVQVDSESTISCDTDGDGRGDVDGVEVSNSGQFVATITLWPDDEDGTNPTLISGSHELIVEDSQGFIGSTRLTIAEPTISVLPDVVGPRDYVAISGENWPIDNTDNSNSGLVAIEISEGGRTRSYSVYADNTGRFSIEHRVSKDVAIPSTNQVKGNYSDGEIVKVGNFSVPAATVTVTPSSAQPGDMVNLSATDMPVYASADYLKIGGTVFNDPGANTDIDGNITIDGVLVPGLDPGTYSVVINVDGTVAIGELEVLAEDSAAGAGAELPGALEGLDDNLVRVFHFNDVDKSWDFYDPRPDFADLNTLTTMVNGEPYWVLVSDGQEDVVLNNRARTLTCVGGDCWNQLVW